MSFSSLLFYFLIIVPSAIIHEYAHGAMADKLGDPTARYAGRLSLDPRVHIDLWGTILMPLFLFAVSGGSFMFAYAKPVPFNPYNLRNQRWGPALVAIAGPLSNLLLACAFALAFRALPFLPSSLYSLGMFFSVIIFANLMLLVFNLVPLPPLDGSKVLYAILPASAYKIKMILEQFGFLFLIIFLVFLSPIINPIIEFLYNLLLGL